MKLYMYFVRNYHKAILYNSLLDPNHMIGQMRSCVINLMRRSHVFFVKWNFRFLHTGYRYYIFATTRILQCKSRAGFQNVWGKVHQRFAQKFMYMISPNSLRYIVQSSEVQHLWITRADRNNIMFLIHIITIQLSHQNYGFILDLVAIYP